MSVSQLKLNPKILHSLIDIKSPSNFETTMREYIKSIIPSHPKLSIISDRNTSLAFFLDKGLKKTILIDAHMDEISGQVIAVTDDGFLTVTMTGPLLEYMHGRPIILFSSKTNTEIKGTMMIQQAHLKDYRDDNEDYYNKKILYIDIGSSSKQESLKKLEIGDPFVLDYSYYYLKKHIITSRGLDNKLGVYILIHLLQYFLKKNTDLQYNVIFNFTGDEETGKSSVSHFKDMNIQYIVVIDTDWSSDMPFLDETIYGEVSLGKGPVVTRSDEDDGLFSTFKQLSNMHNIPLQVMVPMAGGSMLSHYIKTYTTSTQFIAVPLRNIHSPVETANLRDCVQLYQLMILFLNHSLDKKGKKDESESVEEEEEEDKDEEEDEEEDEEKEYEEGKKSKKNKKVEDDNYEGKNEKKGKKVKKVKKKKRKKINKKDKEVEKDDEEAEAVAEEEEAEAEE